MWHCTWRGVFFFLVYAPDLLEKLFLKIKPTLHAVYFLSTTSESSTCLMHMRMLLLKRNVVLPEDTAEDRFQQAESGQQWTHINCLLHMLRFLSELQIQVLCWKFVLVNGEESNSTKLRSAHRTLQYHLSLSFDPWIAFSWKLFLIFNFLIINFCAVQNFKSGWGLCFV